MPSLASLSVINLTLLPPLLLLLLLLVVLVLPFTLFRSPRNRLCNPHLNKPGCLRPPATALLVLTVCAAGLVSHSSRLAGVLARGQEAAAAAAAGTLVQRGLCPGCL